MKLIHLRFTALLMFLSLYAAPAFAADEVEIPFHLAKGQMLYEKYCSSCHRWFMRFTSRRIMETNRSIVPYLKA
jgi:hypothetical protein